MTQEIASAREDSARRKADVEISQLVVSTQDPDLVYARVSVFLPLLLWSSVIKKGRLSG